MAYFRLLSLEVDSRRLSSFSGELKKLNLSMEGAKSSARHAVTTRAAAVAEGAAAAERAAARVVAAAVATAATAPVGRSPTGASTGKK